ncbi:ATP-dependent Clp protease proteolytic subunit [Mesorhizobium sp. M4B.F.Ca.ET.214.01.1.1]|uniref:ATP-dependent Clp protease proteolytic subunit n=1 Tax=Mesorhizobium sp. M4B.F.Ca.ET.214.01.1.1 TaxID=2563955 RepID=UPI001674AB63|nr:ATP-dependent Clp protease proteolytic subunit [Mesorhizobium sp. M4B.F.Ca.ET.214.01.1.1]
MSADLLARIAALEGAIAEFLPAALERRRNGFEPCDRLMAKVRAKAEIDRDVVCMSVAEVAPINMVGEVDDAMATAVCDQLEAARLCPTIEVFIDSEGGDFDAAVRIFRAIRWHAATLKRARLGRRCMSAGVLVAMGCDVRIASPNTEFLLHLTADQPDHRERWTIYRHLESMRRLRWSDQQYLNVIADASGADLAELAIEAAKDEPQPLAWCLAHGLIHEIEVPK